MGLTDHDIQVKMTTQIIMNSKKYTSYEPLIIFFDERGVFCRNVIKYLYTKPIIIS